MYLCVTHSQVLILYLKKPTRTTGPLITLFSSVAQAVQMKISKKPFDFYGGNRREYVFVIFDLPPCFLPSDMTTPGRWMVDG